VATCCRRRPRPAWADGGALPLRPGSRFDDVASPSHRAGGPSHRGLVAPRATAHASDTDSEADRGGAALLGWPKSAAPPRRLPWGTVPSQHLGRPFHQSGPSVHRHGPLGNRRPIRRHCSPPRHGPPDVVRRGDGFPRPLAALRNLRNRARQGTAGLHLRLDPLTCKPFAHPRQLTAPHRRRKGASVGTRCGCALIRHARLAGIRPAIAVRSPGRSVASRHYR
jgi:hypothetical protein